MAGEGNGGALPVNHRAGEMARIVWGAVGGPKWRGYDFGTGTASFATQLFNRNVIGRSVLIDRDITVAVEATRAYPELAVMQGDIEAWVMDLPPLDVAICTSVLPYLEKPKRFLEAMATVCPIAIIECQYAGDGPGFSHIREDSDMRFWLRKHYSIADVIGRTYTDGRGHRSLWLCYRSVLDRQDGKW